MDDMNMDMGMKMAFFASAKVRILFEGWNVTTVGGLVGSVIAVLLFATLYECLKSFNSYMNLKPGATEESMPLLVRNTSSRGSSMARHRSWGAQLTSTLRYVLQLIYGYLLMLIGMTYNVWLFLAIIIGCGIGYLIFSPWQMAEPKKAEPADHNASRSQHSHLYGSQQTERYPVSL